VDIVVYFFLKNKVFMVYLWCIYGVSPPGSNDTGKVSPGSIIFVICIMAPNSIGKPLVTVREINAVGRGTKLTPRVRKSAPADLKKMKEKHQVAERRAVSV